MKQSELFFAYKNVTQSVWIFEYKNVTESASFLAYKNVTQSALFFGYNHPPLRKFQNFYEKLRNAKCQDFCI